MAVYRGLATRIPSAAIEEYKRITGEEPTVMIARPDFILEEDHPLVIRSRLGMANGLLVTHLITAEEIRKHQNTLPAILLEPRQEYSTHSHRDYKTIPEKKPGRPSQRGGSCPHCGNQITNFERLGFWYGWQLGIIPPYWEELRSYVFQRDDYTCYSCHQRLKPNQLQCHHIQRKEDGGPDSSRNLRTLCAQCHLDTQPIMPDEENQDS